VLLLAWLGMRGGPGPAKDLPAAAGASFLVERAYAVASHTASRVLIASALGLRSWRPAAVALATFAVVDGLAMYSLLASWDWESPAVVIPFHTMGVCVALLEAAVAWHFARPAGSRPTASAGTD
jgi:hypothetical protein